MMSVNKWLLFACVLFFLAFAGLLVHTISPKVDTNDQWIINPEVIQKNAEIQKRAFQKQVQVLSVKNNQLQKELSGVRQLLSTAKRKSAQREKEILHLVNKTVGTNSNYPGDSISCDSLRKEVVVYIQEVQQKDSLYERQINIMDSVLQFKDSTIILQNQSLASIENSLQLSKMIATDLANENKMLKKQERKRRFASTLKTIGIAVAIGFVTHSINNR